MKVFGNRGHRIALRNIGEIRKMKLTGVKTTRIKQKMNKKNEQEILSPFKELRQVHKN